jgi:hypothetical protein
MSGVGRKQQQHFQLRQGHRHYSSGSFIRKGAWIAQCFLLVILALYFFFVPWLLTTGSRGQAKPLPEIRQQQPELAEVVANHTEVTSNSLVRPDSPLGFSYWREIAVNLARLPADELLQQLEQKDPFGVRAFEKQLIELESKQGHVLSVDEIRTIFPCPSFARVTLPDQRNLSRIPEFHKPSLTPAERDRRRKAQTPAGGDDGNRTFLFFQHLRKAGGTNFCSLAEHNLPRYDRPTYYCMPDYDWSGQDCAGCFSRYTTQDIQEHMNHDGYRIAGNEWDAFETRFFQLNAVFATSFRQPLHRALSQFRFECVEHRGCTANTVEIFWERRVDLYNVYLWTFTNVPHAGLKRLYRGRDDASASRRAELVGQALDVMAQFHIVLVMEWLAYANDQVQSILGFQNTKDLTQRVRPHISQAKRQDGQETNVLGAAGITKASWDPKTYLSPEQYRIMSEDLALDEILTDAARRFFLERVVCDDMKV